MTQEIPCKDCICLAICKGIAKNTEIPYILVQSLRQKCSICNDYCDSSAKTSWWNEGDYELYEFFTGKSLRKKETNNGGNSLQRLHNISNM